MAEGHFENSSTLIAMVILLWSGDVYILKLLSTTAPLANARCIPAKPLTWWWHPSSLRDVSSQVIILLIVAPHITMGLILARLLLSSWWRHPLNNNNPRDISPHDTFYLPNGDTPHHHEKWPQETHFIFSTVVHLITTELTPVGFQKLRKACLP